MLVEPVHRLDGGATPWAPHSGAWQNQPGIPVPHRQVADAPLRDIMNFRHDRAAATTVLRRAGHGAQLDHQSRRGITKHTRLQRVLAPNGMHLKAIPTAHFIEQRPQVLLGHAPSR
jgi:hypothetical protein